MYVNIHTTRFPGGELRGQILPSADAYFISNLLGSNEVPAIQTQASGNLVFELRDRLLTVSGSFDDLEGDIAVELAGGAHIHSAPNGRNGAVMFPLNLTSEEDNRGAIVAAANNSFTLSEDQYSQLLSQGLYINVHSLLNMPGELRGQIKPMVSSTFRADLTGAQEVPAVNTAATGRIEVNYDGQGSIVVSGTFNNLSSALNQELAGGIHIHTAPAGRNSSVTFVLNTTISEDGLSGIINPQENTFDITEEQVRALMSRGMYVNVHSLSNVPGEIRGQLLPLAKNYFGTSLDGHNEVQPVLTPAGGHILLELTDNTLYITGGFDNLIGDFASEIAGGAHIHGSDARGNGGIALLLDTDIDTDLRGGTYAPMSNSFTISDGLRDSLLNGFLYVNIHSGAYQSGELRGQILDANNAFPSADISISSPQNEEQVDVQDQGDLMVTWTSSDDPDGDLVVYTWQLAIDSGFEDLVFQYKVGDALSFSAPLSSVDSLLAAAGVQQDQSITLYHRVLASDGSVSTPSESLTVTFLRGANEVCDVEAGSLALRDGRTSFQFCAADGDPDIIQFIPQNVHGNYRLVVTNGNDDIIALPSTNTINVDGMSAGEYRVYILAFNGVTGVDIGYNINQIEGCFDLSNPFILDRISCDAACRAPLNIRIQKLSSSSYRLSWDRSSGAQGYQLSLGFEGSSRRFLIPVRRTSVIVSTSSSQVVQVRVRAVCGSSVYSDFSDYVSFQNDGQKSLSRSRASSKVYGDFIIEEPMLSVFPNPSSDFINVKLDDNSSDRLLQIFDATGKIVHRSKLGKGEINERITVHNLQEGIYQVIISSQGILIDQSRFIKI